MQNDPPPRPPIADSSRHRYHPQSPSRRGSAHPNDEVQPDNRQESTPQEGHSPELRISAQVYQQILLTIASKPPETGGLLLGPIGSNDITGFHFDSGANCSNASYTPDHVALNRLMKEEWIPSGLDMKGFVHSHPSTFDRLSPGDLIYIQRLLASNDDMDQFAAPIVIPSEYRFCPFVVLRTESHRAHSAQLILFENVVSHINEEQTPISKGIIK